MSRYNTMQTMQDWQTHELIRSLLHRMLRPSTYSTRTLSLLSSFVQTLLPTSSSSVSTGPLRASIQRPSTTWLSRTTTSQPQARHITSMPVSLIMVTTVQCTRRAPFLIQPSTFSTTFPRVTATTSLLRLRRASTSVSTLWQATPTASLRPSTTVLLL